MQRYNYKTLLPNISRKIFKKLYNFPYTNITKGEIAAIGKKLGIDYAETWSCYKGGEKHCGKCGTCVERKEALAEAGIEDTTEYEE